MSSRPESDPPAPWSTASSGRLRPVRLALGAITVALLAAAFAILFRSLLGIAFAALYRAGDVVTAFRTLPRWARFLVPAAGGLLAGLATRAAARLKGGQGVGDVMETVALGRDRISLPITLYKALGSWLAMASGGSIGREGPLIQFGAAAGAGVGRVFGLEPRQTRAMIAAGTAAGFAAAYNTPFAAILFVLEIVTGVMALEAILPALLATTVATVATRAVVGGGPIYGERAFAIATDWELLAHAATGIVAGVAARGFMSMLSFGETVFARSRLQQPLRASVGGLLVGLCAVAFPEVTGNGYEPLNELLDGRFALATLALLLVAKAFATTASVSSGSPGGVFTPTMLLGAALGAFVGHATIAIAGPAAVGPLGGYALVGMAAMTAATTHAPVMAAVLVFELSGDYAIVLPLLLATALATTISRMLGEDSIYTAELRRRGLRWRLTLDGRQVME